MICHHLWLIKCRTRWGCSIWTPFNFSLMLDSCMTILKSYGSGFPLCSEVCVVSLLAFGLTRQQGPGGFKRFWLTWQSFLWAFHLTFHDCHQLICACLSGQFFIHRHLLHLDNVHHSLPDIHWVADDHHVHQIIQYFFHGGLCREVI